MKLASQHILAAALCALGPLSASGIAVADTVASPLVQDNLAVYPIRAAASGSDGLTSIAQAVRDGGAKIYRDSDGRVAIDNQSGSTVFVPMGTLFVGGTQDQVSAGGMTIPPGAHVTIDTYCVDPFRNTARAGEDPDAYTTSGLLVPWRTAKLSMLSNASTSLPVDDIRQSGVWWSIDTLRTRLEARLGEPLEPPAQPQWTRNLSSENRGVTALAARASTWTSSLPLALHNARLEQAQASYVAALGQAPSGKIVGAAFAINGSIAGAEVYHDPALAAALWPQLVRAYATEALATRPFARKRPPSVAAVREFLNPVARATGTGWTIDNTTHILPTSFGLYAEARDSSDTWISRSYLPKLGVSGAAWTPDALAVDILQRGEVNGRLLSELSRDERISFERAGDRWSPVISEMPSPQASSEPSLTSSVDRMANQIAAASQHPMGRQAMLSIAAVLLLVMLAGTMSRAGAWIGPWLRHPGAILPQIAGAVSVSSATTLARVRARVGEGLASCDRPLIPSPLALLGAFRNLAPASRRRATQTQRR